MEEQLGAQSDGHEQTQKVHIVYGNATLAV